MRAFFVLFRLRTLEVARSGSTFLLFMTLPFVLLGVVAVVFANGHPFERKEIVIVADPRGEALAAAIEDDLSREPEVRIARAAGEEGARARIRARMASAALVVTAPDQLRLVTGPRERLFSRGLASSLAPRATVSEETMPVPRWGYVHYLFPGLLTFSVLLAGLFGTGYAMVRYRATLFLKKLATTPLSRTSFVAAQVASRTLLVLVQLASMVAVGRLVFDLPLSALSASWLVVVTVFGLLTFTGAGFVLAAVIKTETLVVDVINALSVPLVFFSEIFFPLSELPGWLGAICARLPSTTMVRLTREILLFGVTDATQLTPGLLELGGWAIAMYALSVALFRWHR